MCQKLHTAEMRVGVLEIAQEVGMGKQVVVRTAADLGAAVAEARRQAGLSQEQLAEQTGIARTYLARIETGLTVALLDRILLALRRLGAAVVVTLPDETETETETETP